MIEIGLKGHKTLVVTDEMLADKVGSGLVSVFATPSMIAAIENTATESIAPYLDEGQTSVGTAVNVTHLAATPVGMTVNFETEVCEISNGGRIITFKVRAYDEKDVISEGFHSRAVVYKERFQEKASAKKG